MKNARATAALLLALTGLLGGCAADTASTTDPEATQNGPAATTSQDGVDTPAEELLMGNPTGPVYAVTAQQWNYPFELQGIGRKTFPQVFGEPAPAGKVHYVVAVRFSTVLTDRDTEGPSAFHLRLEWPEADCEGPFGNGDRYACKGELLEYLTGYLPLDATRFDDSRSLGLGDALAPEGEYNVAFTALVPDDADLSQARLRWITREDSLPVGSLPELDWS